MSIWPVSNVETTLGSLYDTVKNNPTFYSSSFIQYETLAEFVLAMNRKMKIYKRDIGKVDQIIAYVGGLLSLAVAVCTWFLVSYNKYRFEIRVAEGAFNFDEDGKKIKESDFYLWTYAKYTLYTWINTIFCCRLRWKSCNEIDGVREEINKQMDVSKMFLRLQATERAINYKIPDNEEICIGLMEPPTLAQVRKERLELDYYDEIIGCNPAATIEDLIKENEAQERLK